MNILQLFALSYVGIEATTQAIAQDRQLKFILNTNPEEAYPRAIYLDIGSIRRDYPYVIASLIENHLPDPRNETKSVISTEAFDCQKNSYRQIENFGMSELNGRGIKLWRNIFNDWRAPPEWMIRSAQPGGYGKTILDVVCQEAGQNVQVR